MAWPEAKMRRWVTLYTDAGFKAGRCKVGFIARSSVEPRWDRGSGFANVDNIQTAEALAVLHALRKAGDVFQPKGGIEGFFVRSDNQYVVRLLDEGFSRKNKRRRHFRRMQRQKHNGSLLMRVLEGIYALCAERGWTLQVKHVPAHGKAKTSASRWMNDQADQLGNMRSPGSPFG